MPTSRTRGTSGTPGSAGPQRSHRGSSIEYTSATDRTYEPPTPSSSLGSQSGDHQAETETSENETNLPSSPPERLLFPRDREVTDPIRSKRHWTVECTIEEREGEAGHEQRLRWAPKPVLVSSIENDADGLEFIVVRGKAHTVTERSHSFLDRRGRLACRVRFPDSWVTDDEMDELLYLSSSPPGSDLDEDDVDDALRALDALYEPQLLSSSPLQEEQDDETTDDDDDDGGQDAIGAARILPSSPAVAAISRRANASRQALNARSTERHSAAGNSGGAPNARASSTVSAITWSALNLGRLSSLLAHPTSEYADYGPSIHRGILNALRDGVIRTSTGARPGVIARRLNDRPKRPVQFAAWVVARRMHKVNFFNHHNAEAFLAHWTGDDVRIPCRRCAEDSEDNGLHGIFQGCVVADGFAGKACTNCAYSKGDRKCSFREDTADPLGHVPAVRISSTATYEVRSLSPDSHVSPPTRLPGPGLRSTSISAPSSEGPRRIFSDGPASSRTSMTVDSSDFRDFVYSSRKRPSRSRRGRQDAVMSGGLGSNDSLDAGEDTAPKAKKRQRASDDDQGAQPAQPSDAAPTWTGTSTKSRGPRDSAASAHSSSREVEALTADRCKAPPSQVPSVPPETQRSTNAVHAIVYNNARFKPGTMTEDQYSFILNSCDAGNKDRLRNYWLHAMNERPKDARTSISGYYRHEGCYVLNVRVIPLFCPRPIHIEIN